MIPALAVSIPKSGQKRGIRGMNEPGKDPGA